MSNASGFWIFAHDWNSNSALRTCSAGAERVFIRLCCLLCETQDYGVLSFNDGNDWRQLADLFPGGKWFGIPLRDHDHLGSVPGQIGRPRLKNNSEKSRRKVGEKSEKTRILRVFQELAKRLGLESNVTARGFVELATKAYYL